MMVLGILVMLAFAAAPIQAYDFGGATVTIEGGWRTWERVTQDPRDAAAIDQIMEDFNVQIEWVNNWWPHLVEPLAAAVLAGEAPDLIPQQSVATVEAALSGLLMPLNDYLDPEARHTFNKVPLNDYSLIGGSYYGFNGVKHGGYGVYWNKEMFDALGLPSLYELQESGEWTWDALRDIALQATMDSTGDGVINQFGFHWVGYMYNVTLASNNARVFDFDEEGRPVFVLDQQPGLETLEFLQQLNVHDGVIGSVDGPAEFMAGNIAMIQGNLDQAMQWYGDAELDFGWVPFPKGPNADDYVIVHNHTDNWAIPITSEHDPGALIALCDALWPYIQVLYYPAETYEGLQRAIADNQGANLSDRESYDNFLWGLANSTIYTDVYPVYTPWFNEAMQEMMTDDISPAAVVASVKEAAQAHLYDIFGW